MELSHQLVEELLLLEQQAAQVAALLYDVPGVNYIGGRVASPHLLPV